jgi:hypothetical protein
MRKNLIVTLLLGCLLVAGNPVSADAAGLGRLLGARPAVNASSDVASNIAARPAVAQRPKSKTVAGTPAVSDNLSHATPKFPLLRQLVKLYLLWLLFHPYH